MSDEYKEMFREERPAPPAKTRALTVRGYEFVTFKGNTEKKLKYVIKGEYDTKGRILQEEHFNCTGTRKIKRVPTSTYIWEFKNGRETEMRYYEPLSKLRRKDIYFYNKSDKLSLITHFVDGKIRGRTAYQYDLKGNIRTMISTDGKFREVYVFGYDNEGRLVLKNLILDDEYFSGIKFRYDEYGRKIQQEDIIYFENDEARCGYKTLEYDKAGNLIVTKTYKNKSFKEIEYREYAYSKRGLKVFATTLAFACDCMGVKEIPRIFEIYTYRR